MVSSMKWLCNYGDNGPLLELFTNKREGVLHFMIIDDLKKTNMQVNKFLEDVFNFYNSRIFNMGTNSMISRNASFLL